MTFTATIPGKTAPLNNAFVTPNPRQGRFEDGEPTLYLTPAEEAELAHYHELRRAGLWPPEATQP
mgnify:FL=1